MNQKQHVTYKLTGMRRKKQLRFSNAMKQSMIEAAIELNVDPKDKPKDKPSSKTDPKDKPGNQFLVRS